MVVELSIGQVAGLIALALFAVQLVTPNLIVLVLASAVGAENNALTWSVVARATQSSSWPTLLRSESASSLKSRWNIALLTLAPTLLVLLLSIAGVVTPLGLENDVAVADTQSLSFEYVPDHSPYGGNHEYANTSLLNRICVFRPLVRSQMYACPHSGNKLVVVGEDFLGDKYKILGHNGSYSIAIPDLLRRRFTSGLGRFSRTVSSIFDMQYRNIKYLRFPQGSAGRPININNMEPYAQGAYQLLQHRILEREPYLIEGLVVDPVRAMIGFRNHTAPRTTSQGARWSEDLLFLQPMTKCVDLNVSLQYTRGKSQEPYIFLVDEGGFAELADQAPVTLDEPKFNDVDLLGRATNVARLHNKELARALGLLELDNGRVVRVDSRVDSSIPTNKMLFEMDRSIQLASDYNGVFDMMDEKVKHSLYSVFPGISAPCRNFSIYSPAEKTYSAAICCVLLKGLAHQISEDDNTSRVPFYSCATAVTAAIKQVSFAVHNATTQKAVQISVKDIYDKLYNEDDLPPLWGIENTNQPLIATLPMWGIIDDETAKSPEVLSVRKPKLTLPGAVALTNSYSGVTANSLGYFTGHDNFPGAEFVSQSIASTMSITSSIELDYLSYYVGALANNLPALWHSLSKSATDAATIPNRIWTDLAANAVMGTRGVLGPANDGDYKYPVQPLYNIVKLNYVYAIPAFVIAAVTLGFGVAAFVYLFIGAASIKSLVQLVRQTSAGRILTASDGAKDGSLKTVEKEWVQGGGTRVYNLAGDEPECVSSAVDTNGSVTPKKIISNTW